VKSVINKVISAWKDCRPTLVVRFNIILNGGIKSTYFLKSSLILLIGIFLSVQFNLFNPPAGLGFGFA